MRWTSVSRASMVAALCVSGCGKSSGKPGEDREKCLASLGDARTAIQREAAATAKIAVERAKGSCPAEHDAEIADLEVAITKIPVVAQATRYPEPPPNVWPFLDWVGEHRENLRKTVTGKPECSDDGLYAGWCAGSGSMPSGKSVTVWWSKTNPSATEVEADQAAPGSVEVRCENVGARTIRRWRWPDVGVCSHCVMTSGRLRGWHLYLANKTLAHGAFVRAFTDTYYGSKSPKAAESRGSMETQGVTLEDSPPLTILAPPD